MTHEDMHGTAEDERRREPRARRDIGEFPAGTNYNFGGAIAIEECGCCNQYHRIEYHGDCRNGNERFADPEDAEARLGQPTYEVFADE